MKWNQEYAAPAQKLSAMRRSASMQQMPADDHSCHVSSMMVELMMEDSRCLDEYCYTASRGVVPGEEATARPSCFVAPANAHADGMADAAPPHAHDRAQDRDFGTEFAMEPKTREDFGGLLFDEFVATDGQGKAWSSTFSMIFRSNSSKAGDFKRMQHAGGAVTATACKAS